MTRLARTSFGLAYDAFVSVFPLVLLVATVVALRPLHAGALAVGVGGLVLLWGSRGLRDVSHATIADAWGIAYVGRPGFVSRVVRDAAFSVAAVLSAATGVALLVSTAPIANSLVRAGVLAVSSAGVNVALLTVTYRALTPQVDARVHLPGAAFAGCSWTVLEAAALVTAPHLRALPSAAAYFIAVVGLFVGLWLAAGAALTGAARNARLARRGPETISVVNGGARHREGADAA